MRWNIIHGKYGHSIATAAQDSAPGSGVVKQALDDLTHWRAFIGGSTAGREQQVEQTVRFDPRRAMEVK